MPYPTYKDSGSLVRSVKTVSSTAAGTPADPDIHLTTQPQTLNAGNSGTILAPGAAFTGVWVLTRSVGIVRVLTVLASNVPLTLGGTFTFQFSEDGATPTITEARTITDFTTVRDFDLLNAGAYYRVLFTPSRVMVAAEAVYISTTLRLQDDGPFVRFANQELEEANAAMPSAFSYQKAFGLDMKSKNVRASDVSAANSSEALLGIAGVFTGTAVEATPFQNLSVFVGSDQAGTLTIQFATKAADFGTAALVVSVSRTYTPGTGQGFTFTPVSAFFRVLYTNGAIAQTSFRLQTVAQANTLGPVFSPLTTTLSDNALAQSTRAVLTGRTPSGSYANVPTNVQGNLIGADFLTEVAKGNVSGHRLIYKSGVNPDVDTAAVESVWGGGGLYTFPAAAATVSCVSDSGLDTAAGTGARTVTILGLNASYVEISETVTLNGIVPVLTVASFLRINGVVVATAGSGATNAGNLTFLIGATTAAYMAVGYAAANAAVVTVPAGYTAYLLNVAVSSTNNTASSLGVVLRATTGINGILAICDSYGSHSQSGGNTRDYPAPLTLPEKTDIRFDAIVGANNNEVQVSFSTLLVAL